MSHNHNPWTSIADLLSGFVVVLLILFATAAALPRFPPTVVLPKPGLTVAQQAVAEREARRRRFLKGLAEALTPYVAQGLVRVDEEQALIELSDVSFSPGSACLTTEASHAIAAIEPIVAEQLLRDPDLTIQVEGHCDPTPVQGVRNACGWFADNTQLSTLRASNVRDLLIATTGASARVRMPVMGWGPDRLRNAETPTAAENRRVELHMAWRTEPSGASTSVSNALSIENP